MPKSTFVSQFLGAYNESRGWQLFDIRAVCSSTYAPASSNYSEFQDKPMYMFYKAWLIELAHQTWESWAYRINTLFARDRILGNNTNAFWRAQSEVRNGFCQVIVIAMLDLRLTTILLWHTWLLVLWCIIGMILVSRIKWFLLKYLFFFKTWRRHWILMMVFWTHRLKILRMNGILSHEFIWL